MKARQVAFLLSKGPHGGGEVLRNEVLVAFPVPPDVVDGLPDRLSQTRALGIRIRPEVGEREIELEHFGGEGLDRGVLAGIDAVSGPDQKPHCQRRQ